MKVTLLVDHRPQREFQAEFGLSLLLEYRNGKYLFDTGSGAALRPNLLKLGIAPGSIRKVILSHGHCDHTGGLAALAPETVYACRGITMPHYSRHEDATMHKLTMPEAAQDVLQNTSLQAIAAFSEIAKDIYLTGPIPRVSAEDCGGNFFHDLKCTMKDDIPEETALVTSGGILATGCCHAGILNTLFFCEKFHPEIKIHTIIGGLHLRHASPSRLALTAAYFRRIKLRRLALLHCTGDEAIDYLKQALPDCEFVDLKLGKTRRF